MLMVPQQSSHIVTCSSPVLLVHHEHDLVTELLGLSSSALLFAVWSGRSQVSEDFDEAAQLPQRAPAIQTA